MTVDLSTLRARVEAARALAAQTGGTLDWTVEDHGEFKSDPAQSKAQNILGFIAWHEASLLDQGGKGTVAHFVSVPDALLAAAAPDLVGHLADALGLAESQAVQIDQALAELRKIAPADNLSGATWMATSKVDAQADSLACAVSDLADIRAALRLPASTPWPNVLARARSLADRDPARTLDDEGLGGGDGGGQ